MKGCFITTIAALLGGLTATASGLVAPIDGYKIVDITWELQPNISGLDPINVTGTVQQAWEYINNTWPQHFVLPVVNETDLGPPPTSRQPPANATHSTGTGLAPTGTGLAPTGVREDAPARETGLIHCFNWPDASEWYIEQGIKYLFGLPGKPAMGPGPGECGRVSCSWSSAIWWCNDNDHDFTLDSFRDIANAAADIRYLCRWADPWTATMYTSGQDFYSENWNVIVRYDDDNC